MFSAVFSRTLKTLNQWAAVVQNAEDLYAENHWDYLTENLERSDNLHNMKQFLHATSCGTIC